MTEKKIKRETVNRKTWFNYRPIVTKNIIIQTKKKNKY